MPDSRQHRGPHPEDRRLFAEDQVPGLQAACADLVWLLNRDYALPSSLKLVGDRYELTARQRTAVSRSVCRDDARALRSKTEQVIDEIAGQEIWIDGYNVLTSLEAALSGGVILHGRDGCYRDMASMHGSYRKVIETIPALELLGQLLSGAGMTRCHWLLDQPVSNSGRLKTLMQEVAESHEWNWEITLVRDPDADLIKIEGLIATSDSYILDHATAWFNLARKTINTHVPNAWIVPMDCCS